MKQLLFNTDESTERTRAQVGIGTLIVFIAMVLVAAIAAGVLINTAGFLQTQAEDTGTSSTEQVADNLNVITEVGNVSGSDKINQLRLGVQPAAGSNDINLAKLTLQYVSDEEFANLVVGNDTTGATSLNQEQQAEGDTTPNNIVLTSTDVSENNYLIEVVTAENEDDVVMTDNADRYELVIPLDDTLPQLDDDSFVDDGSNNLDDGTAGDEPNQPDLAALDEGEQVEITITTEVGAQTVSFLQVPDSLSGDDAGSTVNL